MELKPISEMSREELLEKVRELREKRSIAITRPRSPGRPKNPKASNTVLDILLEGNEEDIQKILDKQLETGEKS